MNQWRRIDLELKLMIVISMTSFAFFTDETAAAVDQLFVQRN